MLLLTQNPFPLAFHDLIIDVLRDKEQLSWRLQTDPGKAASGQSWQLDINSKTNSLRFSLLLVSLSKRIAEVSKSYKLIGSVDELEALIPQAFPVLMIGSKKFPPHQTPHQDNHLISSNRYICPKYTFVYYVEAFGCIGGDLILLDSLGFEEKRISPITGRLVCIAGDQWHAVSNMTSGWRLSLVVNFYDIATEKIARRFPPWISA